MSNITPTAGAKLFISEAAITFDPLDTDSLETNLEGLGYKEVKTLEDLGEVSAGSYEDLTFRSIDQIRLLHLKGARDGGTMTVVVGRLGDDEGQQYLRAAANDTNARGWYGVKIELNDNPDPEGDGNATQFLFVAAVSGPTTQFNDGGSVVRDSYELRINSDVVIIEADAGDS